MIRATRHVSLKSYENFCYESAFLLMKEFRISRYFYMKTIMKLKYCYITFFSLSFSYSNNTCIRLLYHYFEIIFI